MNQEKTNTPDLENVIDDLIKKEKKRRTKLALYLLIPIFLVLSLLGLSYSLTQEAQKTSNENVELQNEKENLQLVVSQVEKQEAKQEEIEALLTKYLDFGSKYQIDSMMIFLSDTLDRYYLQENISKEEVKRLDQRYVNRFSSQKVIIKDINVISEDTVANAFVSLEFTRDGNIYNDIFKEIKLDSNSKIFYIRDFLPPDDNN